MPTQVMTIVWNDGETDPTIISDGILGTLTFRQNEVDFLKKTLESLERKSKELERKYHDSGKTGNFLLY